MIETQVFHHFEANVLLYLIVSKPQFLNLRLMPHLVVVVVGGGGGGGVTYDNSVHGINHHNMEEGTLVQFFML